MAPYQHQSGDYNAGSERSDHAADDPHRRSEDRTTHDQGRCHVYAREINLSDATQRFLASR